MGSILSVQNLQTAYKTRNGELVYAVDTVSFSLEKGKTLGIAGESGCGKSTLALSLMGHYFPPLTHMGGEILIDGQNIMSIPYETLRTTVLGSKIAYIPQAAMNALNPTLRVFKFVYHIMKERGKTVTKDQVKALLLERFKLLGLPERAVTAFPSELSGGMKQRVVIAVSTILNPEILIADEPTSALDVTSQKLVIKMIQDMIKMGIVGSVVYITHELPLLRQITDNIMVMYAGQIVEYGSTEEVIFDSLSPYTKALMGSIIVPEKDVKEWKIVGIPGSPPNLKQRFTTCRFADRCQYCGTACKEHFGKEQSVPGTSRLYRCDLSESELREVYANA